MSNSSEKPGEDQEPTDETTEEPNQEVDQGVDYETEQLQNQDSREMDESDTEVLTLNDVLELEDQLMENTTAVLGAANDKKCSYEEGYLKRQALYSCLTCIPEAKDDPDKAGGVCLACCYHCHEGHDLIELYTKRNFRCDCGNSKFAESENKCVLNNEKTDMNELNVYNQNFAGTYCVCHRPFPDPEDPIPDEMIQCIICEDWYHSRHLGIEVPSDNFAEMTCEQCITKHEFLLHYDGLTMNRVIKSKEDSEVDITTNEETQLKSGGNKPADCKKPKEKSARVAAKFWADVTWRKELCTCDDCLRMYEAEEVAFLLDYEDPVHLYEERSKAKALAAAEDQNKKLMNSVDRVQLVETILAYNDLKANLGEYLKKFAENKKVVRAEDIKEFFAGMKSRKKQKVEIPHNCH
ncbi:putative E3 ubiquitin-protein ligase UBR7 [Anthonomus grandis grandis]|uniref:putative E3 ubiquitin-protein ligase UBR7 n=1 Tax=Anthonomus grandis grandis TaxID=2921223 RepID=UPI00216602DB|nr:putative E3 ubiquitin-protein ligase UBR7 [Anthonomus grandis grandis]